MTEQLLNQIKQISQITNNIYIGSSYSESEYDKFSLIINIDYPDNKAEYDKAGISGKVIRLGIPDNPKFNIYPFFTPITDYIRKYVKQNEKVLIHCLNGISRSVTFVIAYLIRRGMSFRDAYMTVKLRRAIMDPNAGFVKQLIEYEKNLRK